MFYTKLNSVQCPCCDVLIVLDNLNAVIGTQRAVYKLCVGHHGSGTMNDKSRFLVSETTTSPLALVQQYQEDSKGDQPYPCQYVLIGKSYRTEGFFSEVFVTDHRPVVAIAIPKGQAVDTCRNVNYSQGGLRHWIRGCCELSSKPAVISLNVSLCVS